MLMGVTLKCDTARGCAREGKSSAELSSVNVTIHLSPSISLYQVLNHAGVKR